MTTGYSLGSNPALAAKELSEKLMGDSPKFVVFFGSSTLDPQPLGVSVEEAGTRWMSNPIGLMLGDEPYVRSPQQCKGESMVFLLQRQEWDGSSSPRIYGYCARYPGCL